MGTWLVTGGSGFLGRQVLDALRSALGSEPRVIACGRRAAPEVEEGSFLAVDLEDPRAIERMVGRVEPDVVIHAAGATPPGDPERFERVNVRGTVHLLSALKKRRRALRVVLVGSAAELGPVAPEHLPVREDHPCRPIDAYGRSKRDATSAGLLARRPLEVVVGRVFNPIGPGMPTRLAFGRFAARLAEPGPDPLTMRVGNLDARRDFIDVRDVAGALIALALKGRPGLVYNVGTGVSRRVGDGLEHLVKLSGRRVDLEIEPPGPCGPSDSRADIRRIVEQTGWAPRVTWEQSLGDLWDEARSRYGVASGSPFRHVA
jgi:GDP-4-dehydro-6-deoxy-D-mannose reductase